MPTIKIVSCSSKADAEDKHNFEEEKIPPLGLANIDNFRNSDELALSPDSVDPKIILNKSEELGDFLNGES